MSKRTTTLRNSPSPSRIHKKRKTAENEIVPSSPLEVGSPSSSDIVSLLKGLSPVTNNAQGVLSTGDKASATMQVDSNGWTKVEKRKEKKAKKEAQKALNQPPSFAFNVQQLTKMRTVSISVCTLLMTLCGILKLTRVQDVRDLALHLTGQAQSPSWLRITNQTSIQRIVVLLVPGITPDVFNPPLSPQPNTSNPLLHIPLVSQNQTSTSSQLPFLSTFLHAVPTKAPGDAQRMHSVLHGFFMGPVTGEERKRRMAERIKGVHIWLGVPGSR